MQNENDIQIQKTIKLNFKFKEKKIVDDAKIDRILNIHEILSFYFCFNT